MPVIRVRVDRFVVDETVDVTWDGGWDDGGWMLRLRWPPGVEALGHFVPAVDINDSDRALALAVEMAEKVRGVRQSSPVDDKASRNSNGTK